MTQRNNDESEQDDGNGNNETDDDNDDDDKSEKLHFEPTSLKHPPRSVSEMAKESHTPSTVSMSTVNSTDRKRSVSSFGGMLMSDENGQPLDLFLLQTKRRKEAVFTFVKDTLFHKVKFIVNDQQTSWNFPNFAVPIMDDLIGKSANDKKREFFWEQIKSDAKKALQERRATVNGAIKNAVVGT